MSAVDYPAAKRGATASINEAIAEAGQLRTDLERIAVSLDSILARLQALNAR